MPPRYSDVNSLNKQLKGNGFGRFIQTIVLRVALNDSDAISTRLGVTPEADTSDPTFVKLTWTRLTNRPRDDEDIVFDLHRELSDLDDASWSIDWSESEY